MGDPTIVQWEDIHGKIWNLAGEGAGEQGVILEATDVVDLFDEADVDTIRDESAFQIGSTYRGKRILTRYPVFDVLIGEELGGPPWRQNFSEWKRGWSYDIDGKLWVEDEDSRRYIELRKTKKIGYTPATDPNQQGVVSVEMQCVAGNPFFREPDAVATFTTTVDHTGDAGVQVGTLDFAQPLNPCDVDIWLTYEIQGYAGVRVTLPDYSWGNDEFDRATEDASRAIVLPEMLAGEHLLIDTDKLAPGGQFNSSLDTEFQGRMDGVRFMYRIPPNTTATTLPIAVKSAPIGLVIKAKAPRQWWAATGGQTL